MLDVNNLRLRPFDIDKILGWIISALAFIFPITVLTVNRADSAILLLMGVIGIYAFLKQGVGRLKFTRQDMVLISIFACWYVTIILCYFAGDKTDTGFKLLGRNFRLLFFIPAFIACRWYLANARTLILGLALAPMAILGLGLWQFASAHNYARASGFVDPIPFGDLSMAMAFMGLAIMLTRQPLRQSWRYLLAGSALLAGIGASILSGTRGGWVALPVLLVVTIFVLSRRSGKRAFRVFVACSLVIVIAGLLAPEIIIKNRASEMIKSLDHYRTYTQLIDEGDVSRIGCLNAPLFMTALANELVSRYSSKLDIRVVDDTTALKRAGLDNQCQSGNVLRVTNRNKTAAAILVMKRSVITPIGPQSAEFIVRGQGMISIVHGNPPGWKNFEAINYAVVKRTQTVKDLSWPVFWLPPDGTIYVVPIQNSTGEYVFPFANDSVGERFEMWRAAWHIFRQHVFLGSGTGSFMQEVSRRAHEGDISPQVSTFDHPHNDYMNDLSDRGLLGLVVYLLAMGYPLVLFMKALRSDDDWRKAAGFAGVIMISGLLVFGLTETMFIHSIVMSWYVAFMAMLMAIVLGKKDVEMRDVGT